MIDYTFFINNPISAFSLEFLIFLVISTQDRLSCCLSNNLLILKSRPRSCRFCRFLLLWNWPCIYVCQESTMSQPCPLSIHQKHLKGKKSWERGWVIRFVVWLSPFDWNFYKKDGLFLSQQYTWWNKRLEY